MALTEESLAVRTPVCGDALGDTSCYVCLSLYTQLHTEAPARGLGPPVAGNFPGRLSPRFLEAVMAPGANIGINQA